MSAVQQTEPVIGNQKATRLYQHLKNKLDNQDELYVKSKFIADEVGLSPKEIGGLIPQLQAAPIEITIEKWSYTSATTWRITE